MCPLNYKLFKGAVFSAVLLNMFNKLLLTFESVDEIIKCYFSNKSYEQYSPVVSSVTLRQKGRKINHKVNTLVPCAGNGFVGS